MGRSLLAFVFFVSLFLALSQREVRAGKPCTVPKSWGALRSITSVTLMTGDYVQLAFEDEAGTVRILHGDACRPMLEISRTP